MACEVHCFLFDFHIEIVFDGDANALRQRQGTREGVRGLRANDLNAEQHQEW